MPTGKRWSKVQGKWVNVERERAFEYGSLNREQMRSAALIISFFRYYPDLFYDIIKSPNAKYKLELPQRLMLRVWARYRNTYITGGRGITKSYTLQLSKNHDGIFYPGEKIRYVAPAQKQSAKIASDAFKTVEENFPLMASWWNKNSDSGMMFRITTPYHSEFTMYAPRGDNCSAIVGEEIAQEGDGGFNIEDFEANISPTCRLGRKINGKDDRTHINLKETYISNASSRQNKAYTVYRTNALSDMICGDKYDGFCMDISWVSALLCNLRDIEYYKKEKKKLTPENWLREMCVRYTGTGDDPLITDTVLARSKKLKVAEFGHCQDPNTIYIVAHDVSYTNLNRSAKCSDVVLKLTRYTDINRRDRYRKQVVFLDNYPPPTTDYLQAQRVKHLWAKFCLNGGQPTYLVIDTQNYGTGVLEELMKPSNDGLPTLCCYEHMGFLEIEQPDALPVLYPMKASTGTAGVDPDGEMVKYAQLSFEQDTVELLTSNVLDGVEAYKAYHCIKDDSADTKISMPYKHCDTLCQQIANLKTRPAGMTVAEERRSKYIQRDIWSALKYALRMAQKLEIKLVKENYRKKSSWQEALSGQSRRAAPNQQSASKRQVLLNQVRRRM